MSNISNERLEEFIRSPLENSLTRGEQMEMAQRLLAFEKASKEAVAWTDAEELRDASKGGVGYLFAIGATANKFADPRRQIMLYTVPQLQPASNPYTLPDEMTPEMMRAVQLNSELGAYATSNLTGAYTLFGEFWRVACRTAKEQSSSAT